MDFLYICSANPDLTLRRICNPCNQSRQRCLSSTGWSDKSDMLSRTDLKTDIVQGIFFCPVIPERYMFKLDRNIFGTLFLCCLRQWFSFYNIVNSCKCIFHNHCILTCIHHLCQCNGNDRGDNNIE